MTTVLIVPGAWLPVTTYRRLIRALEEESFLVEFAAYPSFNPRGDPRTASCATDTAHLRDRVLLPLLNQGRDVVMVMHSYGGMPGAAAATGLSKRTRQAQRRPGGVIGLIMISAFAVAEGRSCVDACGGRLAPWVLEDVPSPGLCSVDNPYRTLAADVPADVASIELQLLEPQATRCFLTRQPPPAFRDPAFRGLLAYVKLRHDQAIPLAAQEAMIRDSGVQWITRSLSASHNAPFVTRVEETVKFIEDAVARFDHNLS